MSGIRRYQVYLSRTLEPPTSCLGRGMETVGLPRPVTSNARRNARWAGGPIGRFESGCTCRSPAPPAAHHQPTGCWATRIGGRTSFYGRDPKSRQPICCPGATTAAAVRPGQRPTPSTGPRKREAMRPKERADGWVPARDRRALETAVPERLNGHSRQGSLRSHPRDACPGRSETRKPLGRRPPSEGAMEGTTGATLVQGTRN